MKPEIARKRRTVMKNKIGGAFALLLVAIVAFVPALLLTTAQPAYAQATENMPLQFVGGATGGLPWDRLTFDSSGNLYGTASSYGFPNGGGYGGGLVFELSPAPASGCPSGTNPGNGWCEKELYTFCSVGGGYCTDGNGPLSYVTFDSLGNFYGTTWLGGAYDFGTVFKLSPEPLSGCPSGSNTGNGWCETVLYSFCSQTNCTDGVEPAGGLVWDSSGNLYGTTSALAEPNGLVYKLSPSGVGGWNYEVIYDLPAYPSAGLAIDAARNLYGVDSLGDGQVFKLAFANGVWKFTVIYTFTGQPTDGANPEGTPAVDRAGNVYGTTWNGGSKNRGTVWKLTPVTTGKNRGTYTEEILHSFTSKAAGYYPRAGLTLDSIGNIYGATAYGGKYFAQCPTCGTLFELAASGTTYRYKLLWSFDGTDGSFPIDNPILDSSGNLYGTTSYGGDGNCISGCGVVYELKP
jgi:uncharacterized repeat protein (TIGR03803 family)